MEHNGQDFHIGYFDSLTEAEAGVIAARLATFTHNEVDKRAAGAAEAAAVAVLDTAAGQQFALFEAVA